MLNDILYETFLSSKTLCDRIVDLEQYVKPNLWAKLVVDMTLLKNAPFLYEGALCELEGYLYGLVDIMQFNDIDVSDIRSFLQNEEYKQFNSKEDYLFYLLETVGGKVKEYKNYGNS